MLILAIESSAKSASVAIGRDGELVAQYFQNSGLTHSRTLLPMVEDMFKNAELSIGDVDVIAAAHGPGSFTGIRIGVAAALGLAWALDTPAVGVSTLLSMAWLARSAPADAIVCPVMDARRGEVYNALFEIRQGNPVRLCDDRAISLAELAEELKQSGRAGYLLGDGAAIAHAFFSENGVSYLVVPDPTQSAWGVVQAFTPDAPPLTPVYLRPSQAERERK